MRQRINGYDFQLMVESALNNIRLAEQRVNSMNVFPVADGDTGTNMRLTLENGFKRAQQTRHLGLYLKDLAAGMLLGARGNSGVILSQLFKGMSNALINKGIVNPGELRDSFILGYKTAYKAVVNPVEGTILTVAREGIEEVRYQIRGKISLEDSLKLYLEAMYRSLSKTPEKLDVLKEANVLDSGAYGYIVIIEGMYKYLIGEKVESNNELVKIKTEAVTPLYFDENSNFVEGYCMEFLLQLLSSRVNVKEFNLNNYINHIKELGTSIVCLKEGSIVKVHIHTLNPSPIIDFSKQFGEFINFKLENMQLQHNEYSIVKNKSDKPAKKLGIIAVVNGQELENIYRELGCDYVISSSGNMNASSNEFLNAIDTVNAEKIVIFPNNSNSFGAAHQAIDIARAKDRVFIVPTKNMIEGIVALQMDLPDDDPNSRMNAFHENIKLATTIGVTKATKKYEKGDFCCKINDEIALINDELVAASTDVVSCLEKAIHLVDLTDKSGMLIYLSKDVSDELEEKLNAVVSNIEGIDYQITKGGQEIYDVLVGIF